MDCANKEKKPSLSTSLSDGESAGPQNMAPSNKSRRAVVPVVAAAIGAGILLPQWRRPVIDAVLLPAHAQTTGAPINPDWLLTGLTTALGVPSGEVTPVETYSSLQLSGCGLLPGTTITVTVTALLTPSGELPLISAASVTAATGSFNTFINVDAGSIVVVSVVDAFRFDIDVDGEPFTYTANAAAIGAAAAGTATPVSC